MGLEEDDDVIKLDWRRVSHLIGLIEDAIDTGRASMVQDYLLKDIGLVNYKVEGIVETIIRLCDNATSLQSHFTFSELTSATDNRHMLNLLLGDAFGEGIWF